MFTEQKKMVPPDGGWGWIVVLGVSVINLCTRSIEPSFGLLFGDLLQDLGVETTGAALIMSTLDALINFSGLFVGPLIRAFSYRKVSLLGSALCALGLMFTYPANSMAHILATYSIINGLGVGLTASATFVTLNNYFVKKRGQAVGFSLAGTAFGMMIMPQAVKVLLELYEFRGAILILGAFSLNAIAGSCLLQPAEWHFISASDKDTKSQQPEMETIKETDDENVDLPEVQQNLINDNNTTVLSELKVNAPDDGTKQKDLPRKSTFPRNLSTMSFLGTRKRKTSKDSIVSSYSRLDFTGSSLQLHLEKSDLVPNYQTNTPVLNIRRNMSYPGVQRTPRNKFYIDKDLGFPAAGKVEEKDEKTTLWQKIVVFMDFDLLKDPIYLNLVFGLSIFYVAEQNFKMVTPFFFKDIGYDKSDIALFLSVQAATDILARLILPPICDRVATSKRTLFMFGIFILAICRSVMAEQTQWTYIMIWLIICGFLRGAALINFTITISEYASLEKLPAAFGLHMVGKGLFVVAIGPILGVIRDTTKSYPVCLHSQTFLILLCCTAWSIEYLIIVCRKKTIESDIKSSAA